MRALTKEELKDLGVTDVRKDGTVFVHGIKKEPYVITKNNKYGGKQQYKVIILVDYNTKRKTRIKRKLVSGVVDRDSWSYATRMIPVARLMLAWFYGEIPANMDADHIDGDTFNNNLNNLQMLTRKENLARRTLTWEQITKLYIEKKMQVEKKK